MRFQFLISIFSSIFICSIYSCPDIIGWLPAGESCYLISQDSMNWFAAQEFCALQGGYLAEIKSEEETSIINEFLSSDQYHWIGLNDLSHPGTWSWKASYEMADYTNWRSIDPDQTNVCAQIGGSVTNQQWADLGCFEVCDKAYCNHALCEAKNVN